jgi:cell division septum initiation protein DivIVA
MEGSAAMTEMNDSTTDIAGQQFQVVKMGLDADQVSDFIRVLLDRNSDLQSKLEHLHSLRRLAEKVVIRAEDQAEKMKQEAEERAQEKLLLAEQRACEILRAAEEEADAARPPGNAGQGGTLPEGN